MARKIDALMTNAVRPKNNGQGVEHYISLGYWKLIDDVETFIPVITRTYPVPAQEMQEQLSTGTTAERIEKYKALIVKYLFELHSGIPIPPAPIEPTFVNSGNLIASIEEYADAIDDYNIAYASYVDNEYADYLVEFETENALAITWAAIASDFVESRSNFEGYPYPFSVQVGD